MDCCWAGNDGVFNNFEFARALGVYLTLAILSPIHIYITRCFYLSRNNSEMRVHEANVVILMSFLIWIRLIFESMYQLTLNLDEETSNHHHTNLAPTFNILSWFSCVLIFGMYFFRVWMFWHRSVKSKKAFAFVENEGGRSTWASDHEVVPFKSRRHPVSRRKVTAVSILSVILATTPIAVVHFAMDCPGCVQRYQLSFIALCPFFMKSFLLLRGVKNTFGVISEYKVVVSLVFTNFAFYFLLMSLPGTKKSYYSKLTDYVFRAFWVCWYLLWLLQSVRNFALDSLKERSGFFSSGPVDRWCIKVGRCCKEHIHEFRDPPSIDNITLPDILSEKESFNLFRFHVEETLCPENLLFFMDVYIHRKKLEWDPFIALTQNENSVIKECAKVEMNWIDEDAWSFPTSREIYNLYVKPFSDLEVNISGKLRKALVALFETSTSKTQRSYRSQSLQIQRMYRRKPKGRLSVSVLELSPAALKQSFMPQDDVDNKIDNQLLSHTYSYQGVRSAGYSRGLSKIKTPFSEKSKCKQLGGLSISLDEIAEHSVKNVKSDFFVDASELSITHLYPVWKTLVNLLRNDSLVRFKSVHNRKQRNSVISP